LAVVSGKTEIVAHLLANGAKIDGNVPPNVKKATTNDETPLMAATRLNHTEIKQLLVEQGAKEKFQSVQNAYDHIDSRLKRAIGSPYNSLASFCLTASV
jgi:ankyrin repeat protein